MKEIESEKGRKSERGRDRNWRNNRGWLPTRIIFKPYFTKRSKQSQLEEQS